jgi:hypothetical protein
LTAEGGGITPEENDDLRREKEKQRKQSNDRNRIDQKALAIQNPKQRKAC